MNSNLKQLFVVFGLVVGLSALAVAGGLTKPRKTYVNGFSTTAALVHAGGGAVYQVTLSTGAALEYVVLVDSGSAVGVAGESTTKAITTRLTYSSATQNTVFTFDPPLLYTNGLVIDQSGATGSAMVTYESGRSIGGN